MITCGTQIVSGAPIYGGGGASLPATPASALLDAGSPSTMVGLNSSGVGEALSASSARSRMGLGTLATQSTATASQISDSTTAGRALLTAADAAAQRTALAVVPSSSTPLIESGSGAVGTSADYARADHVHPAYGGGGAGSGVPARLIAGFTDSNHYTRAATASADAVGGVGYSWLVCGYLTSSTAAARKVWELQATSVGWGLLVNGTTVQMYLAGINSSVAFNIGITLTAGSAFALAIEYVSGQLRATLNGGAVATTALVGTYAPATAASVMGIGGDRVNAVTYGFAEGKIAECNMISGALGDSTIQSLASTASTTYSFASQFSQAQRAALKFSWVASDGLNVRSGIGPLTAGGTLLASQPV